MNVHYGDYKDFSDLVLHLAFNYNKYKPTQDLDKDAKLQYKDTIHILVIFSYNQAVQYLCRAGVHKGHHQALTMSFLEMTLFFGSQFCDKKMTNKWCCRFDNALVTKNRAGKKDGMTELLTVEEGIFRRFFMDTDILSLLYYDIHNQQRPIRDMPHGAQHMMAASWKKAVNKFVEETCDIIKGHYHCRIIKNGQIYPGCLWVHGYIDYAFLLLTDDPHTNKTLAATMVADAAAMVMSQLPKVPASTSQSAPTKMPPTTQTLPRATGPDVIVEEEEVIEVKDEGQEPEQAKEDKETAILSIIHAYQVAEAPPLTPDTPCLTCTIQGEASREQSTDTEMTTAVASLSLSYPTLGEMALLSEMTQHLGPPPGTLPNLEQNVQESVSLSKQMDLDQLRDKSRKSRWDLGKVWSDVTEYEAQKSRVEESSRGCPHQDTERGSLKRSQSKQWEGSPKWQSKSRTHSQSRDARAGDDESQDPSAGGDDSSTQWSHHPKGLSPCLEWIPWVRSDFPAHLSLSDKPAFTIWVELYPYETESWEVKALSFLPDYMHVATKVIAKVLWAMVYVLKGGCCHAPMVWYRSCSRWTLCSTSPQTPPIPSR